MTPEEWWKNFALGMEIDAAGTFIYNGIRSLHELPTLNHPVDSLEVLYNLSVGIERLLRRRFEQFLQGRLAVHNAEMAPAVNDVKILMHAEFVAFHERDRAVIWPTGDLVARQRHHQAGAVR